MKNLITVLITLACLTASAQNFEGYQNRIATDRVMLMFDKAVTIEQQDALIKQCSAVTNFSHIPTPALVICNVNNYAAANQFFSDAAGVKFVSFFITDGNKNYAGVLDGFFVKLADKNFEPLMKEMLKSQGISEVVPDKYIPNLYKVRNNNFKAHNTVDLCALLYQQGWCQYASPDYLLNPLVNSDQFYSREWHIHNEGTSQQGSGTPGADMDVDSAWNVTTGSIDIKVGIIDSGVDTLHPDLMGNILPGHDALGDTTDGYPTPNFQEDGHGTCCAGIVAALKDNNNLGVVGVAPSCKLIPVRSFYYVLLQGASGPLPYATSTSFSDAISWASFDAHADILTNSWGLPPALIGALPGGPQPVTDAILNAYANARGGKGIAMFFSSGNEEDSTGAIWPSSLAQTIAVTATTMCDERKNPNDCSNEDWGANYGPHLDFGAPGVRIATTDMRGVKGFANLSDYYMLFNGTSAACPNAAAIGALILSLRPELGPEDVRNIIAQTCDKVGGYSYDSAYANGSWGKQLGYGRVNAYKAVHYALIYSGINDVTANTTNVQLYPNPSTGILNVTADIEKDADLKVYDITGKQLLTATISNGNNVINLSNLVTGVYLVVINTQGETITRKVSLYR
jgi:subtilisin family serine protease